MFIFDGPYISNYAIDYLRRSKQPVLSTEFSAARMGEGINYVTGEQAKIIVEANKCRWIYTNSENAIGKVAELLGESSGIFANVRILKNKLLFREATQELFPDIYFAEMSNTDLQCLKFEDIRQPFIIKPAVGFLSAGVYRVDDDLQWQKTKDAIFLETEKLSRNFSKGVVDSSTFILESVISGMELAIDAYFDEDNRPVVLNILEHRFSSDHDMGDRLYVTSPEIIREHLCYVEQFLQDLRNLGDFRGFPLHAEIRIDNEGRIRPIEVNPMRFAGWCSTDIAYFAYGINVYEYFVERKAPNWTEILESGGRHQYVIAILEKSKELGPNEIFNYKKLRSRFPSLMELRPIDYRVQPLFAFMFLEVDSGSGELELVQSLDPHDFVESA